MFFLLKNKMNHSKSYNSTKMKSLVADQREESDSQIADFRTEKMNNWNLYKPLIP